MGGDEGGGAGTQGWPGVGAAVLALPPQDPPGVGASIVPTQGPSPLGARPVAAHCPLPAYRTTSGKWGASLSTCASPAHPLTGVWARSRLGFRLLLSGRLGDWGLSQPCSCPSNPSPTSRLQTLTHFLRAGPGRGGPQAGSRGLFGSPGSSRPAPAPTAPEPEGLARLWAAGTPPPPPSAALRGGNSQVCTAHSSGRGPMAGGGRGRRTERRVQGQTPGRRKLLSLFLSCSEAEGASRRGGGRGRDKGSKRKATAERGSRGERETESEGGAARGPCEGKKQKGLRDSARANRGGDPWGPG